MNERTSFWMVWTPKGKIPRVKHTTKGAAETEAFRLSKDEYSKNPFYVLKAVTMYVNTKIERVELSDKESESTDPQEQFPKLFQHLR